MSAQSTFAILFWIKKNQIKNGIAPLYARITIYGKRAEIATHRKVSVFDWNPLSQMLTSKSQEAKEINNYLAVMKAKLLNCQSKLESRGVTVTAEAVKNEFLGVVEKQRFLMEIIQLHNDEIKTLIGKDYSKGTWFRYCTTLKHTKEFLKWKHNLSDISLNQLNVEFISDFEFFLKSKKNIEVNTTAKYIKNIKKIVRECVAKNWLAKDPFMGYKVKHKKTERGFLSDLELQAIQEKEFGIKRLDQIRDIFVFSCYTGLSYIDIFNLTTHHIAVGIDGEKWIFTRRQKTETASRIPLLEPALMILEKYKNNPEASAKGKLLPIPSNQKVNAYLKEISAICGINKELTFHIARHTFATTVTLTNGVPIESVSKMLGHTRIQTTQIYAKILDKKVSHDMQVLRNKFQAKSKVIPIKTGS